MRPRGFSLVEMMVALALAGILVAGAFQMHAAFTGQSVRQQQVAEMQQSLRVADQLLSKTLRRAGSGLEGAQLTLPTCQGIQTFYSIQYSQDNTYPADDIKTTFDSNPGDGENFGTPDWIRVVALDPTAATAGFDDDGANIDVKNPGKFKDGDFFIVTGHGTDPNKVVSCQRVITQVIQNGPKGKLQHNPGQGKCVNYPLGQDPCIGPKGAVDFTKGPARVISAAGALAVFRVDTTDARTPRLMASFHTPGAGPTQWQVVAENIEDLQAEIILGDGTICGLVGNSVDDPKLCDFAKARAVRYTLVARSSSPVPGWNAGRGGGHGDEAQQGGTDGYLRRSITSEIELRNMP